jgi:hypothetical protein
VQLEVLPRHVGKEVLLQHGCEGEAFGRVGDILVLDNGVGTVFWRKGDAVEELGDLLGGVALMVESIYVDHFGVWSRVVMRSLGIKIATIGIIMNEVKRLFLRRRSPSPKENM